MKSEMTATRSKRPKVTNRNLTIRDAQQEVTKFILAKGKQWDKVNDPFFRLTFLVEEMGELARAIVNAEGGILEPKRKDANQSGAARINAIQDALGDIFYHLLENASAYRIDLQDAFQESFFDIKMRYPARPTRRMQRRRETL